MSFVRHWIGERTRSTRAPSGPIFGGRRLAVLIPACIALTTGSRTSFGSGSGPMPPRIATLNTVLTEIATQVGGDGVIVEELVRPGVDPHTFDPSARDVGAMQSSDLILASGLGLEPYLDRVLAHSDTQARVVRVGDLLPHAIRLGTDARHPAELDPHWWQSVAETRFATAIVRDELCRIRPSSAGQFRTNCARYEARLARLDSWVDKEVARLAPAQRQLVTSHDAFAYFARDYGFTVHSIEGVSPDGEANAKHFGELVTLIRRDHIGAIFAESTVNPRLVESLARETGVRPAGMLYADGLGRRGGEAATYVRMYRHNVRTIVEGLLRAR